jgi:hypothetical protein
MKLVAIESKDSQDDCEPRCSCGILLEGQYNNGEEHDECASCREGRLCDEAYELYSASDTLTFVQDYWRDHDRV